MTERWTTLDAAENAAENGHWQLHRTLAVTEDGVSWTLDGLACCTLDGMLR